MPGRLENKRVLVTQSDTYMGPAVVELFGKEDADLVADSSDLTVDGAVASLLDRVGQVDVLVANLALGPQPSPAPDQPDEQWHALFDTMVHPLMQLVRGVLPAMIERKAG